MTRRVRVAVVGTGEWWGREHARVFAARADVELCAIVGRTAAKTERRAAEFATRPYIDLDEMLDEQRARSRVACACRTRVTSTPRCSVIEAGVPLLVEKPLVFDLEEADSLLPRPPQRELFFAINFNHRYARAVQLARGRDRVRHARRRWSFATWRFGGDPARVRTRTPI